MMKQGKLPKEVRQEVRVYFHQRKRHTVDEHKHRSLLQQMSPGLEARVARFDMDIFIQKMNWFKDITVSSQCLISLQRALKSTMYCKNEVVELPQCLCTVKK